jgi:cytochrome c-type biogenesis protein CcmH/NrfG
LLQHDLKKGQRYYEQALRADPGNLEALSNLASILAEKGKYAKAIRIWEKALEIDPGNPDLKQNLESARQKAQEEDR